MKILYLTLICLLSFSISAMQSPLDSMSLRALMAKASESDLTFHLYVSHIINKRPDSNAKSKAIRQLFRIAVDGRHTTSVEALLPHVSFGVAKEYNDLQRRLKTEKLSGTARLFYREISTLLLKNLMMKFAQKQNSFLHTLSPKLLDTIIKYQESEYRIAEPQKKEPYPFYNLIQRDRQNKIDSKSMYRRIDGSYY